MRVLIVAHADAPWTPYFATSFRDRGWTIKLVSMAPGLIEGVDVEFIGVEPFDRSANKYLFLTRVPRVRRIIRDFKPDVVFAPYLSSNGLLAALSGARPLVTAAVGGDIFNYSGRKGASLFLRESSIRFVCRRAELINTVAGNLTDELLRLGVPDRKLLELNFGADISRFRAREAHEVHEARGGPIRLISTRKHEAIYDIGSVIEGLQLLSRSGSPFHCTVLGGGTLLERHREMARDAGLGDQVEFAGHLDHDRLPGVLRGADIYISSSHGDGTSVSLLEAMASGLFPVVTRIQANLPWVEHGTNGLMFDPGDAAGLAEALKTAIASDELRRSARTVNRGIVEERGSMHANLDKLAEALESVAAGP